MTEHDDTQLTVRNTRGRAERVDSMECCGSVQPELVCLWGRRAVPALRLPANATLPLMVLFLRISVNTAAVTARSETPLGPPLSHGLHFLYPV